MATWTLGVGRLWWEHQAPEAPLTGRRIQLRWHLRPSVHAIPLQGAEP